MPIRVLVVEDSLTIRKHLCEVLAADPEIDQLNRALFAFAAYNAGPTRVNQFRRAAARRGLNPNQWFFNVERIASERIGRETVDYVASIFKYYYAYLRVDQQRRLREQLMPPRAGGEASFTSAKACFCFTGIRKCICGEA